MKKTGRILLVAVLLAVMIAPAGIVSAASVTASAMSGYSYNFNGSGLPAPYDSGSNNYWRYTADGNVAYCLDRTVGQAAGNQDVYPPDWSGISYGDRQNLTLAMLYGYDGSTKYGYDADTERVATQVMVYSIIGGMFNTGYEARFLECAVATAPSVQAIRDIYYAMRSQILTHNVRPSFTSGLQSTAPTYSTKYSATTGLHSLTLTDSNGVLPYYSFVAQLQAAGANVSVTGNTITITSSTPFPDTPQYFSTTRSGNTHVTALLIRSINYLYAPDVQMKIMVSGTPRLADPVPAHFGLRSAKGTIEIVKTDSENGEPIEGAVFELFDDAGNSLGTVTTNEYGIAEIHDLYYGSYKLIETQPATGYQDNTTEYDVTLGSDKETVNITNDIKKGYIKITKLSSFDFRILPNAVYGLYRSSDDSLVEELTTDENGEATSSLLRYGRYYLQELDAPERYHIDLNQHLVLIGDEHMGTLDKPMYDNPIIGRFMLAHAPAPPKLYVGEQNLGVPNTGVDYAVPDDEILGYPEVPPGTGILAPEDMVIEYLHDEDIPIAGAMTTATGMSYWFAVLAAAAGAFMVVYLRLKKPSRLSPSYTVRTKEQKNEED